MYSSTNQDVSVTSNSNIWTINWGAIFASLVFIYALSWLLFTLSSAIGLSIIEIPNPHDTNVKSGSLTLSIALYAWLISTIVVTYFLGGWLVGKLSGNSNPLVLSLHGLVVWSCTILIAVLLGALGVNSLLSSAASAVKTTAAVGMNLPKGISSSDKDGEMSQLPSSFQPLIASLKQGIKKGNSERRSSSSQEDDDSDENTSSTKDGTNSEQDENYSQRVDDSSEQDSASSKDQNNSEDKNYSKKENKSNEKYHRAADRIDPQALSMIAVALVQGDEKQAKEIITSNTELDEKQVNELIKSVKDKADRLGKEIEKKANEARQYASAILWLIFISYIVALLACVFGARCGTKEFKSPVLKEAK